MVLRSGKRGFQETSVSGYNILNIQAQDFYG